LEASAYSVCGEYLSSQYLVIVRTVALPRCGWVYCSVASVGS